MNPDIDTYLQVGSVSQRLMGDGNDPAPCNGGDILDQVSAFIRRFVSVSEEQAIAIALFVAHTHAFEAAETTPYLSITSAEKQSGKTRLLEVLNLLVAKPWLTGSASKGVLVRKIDREQPTLLLDESDAAFSGIRNMVRPCAQCLTVVIAEVELPACAYRKAQAWLTMTFAFFALR